MEGGRERGREGERQTHHAGGGSRPRSCGKGYRYGGAVCVCVCVCVATASIAGIIDKIGDVEDA